MSEYVLTIEPGYLGQCPYHPDRDAKHEHFVKFDPPIKSGPFPDIEGVWEYICDECFTKNSQVESAT